MYAGTYLANKTTAATILNNSIMLGYRTSPLADNQTNQIVIGYDATGIGSNTVVLGNDSIVTTQLKGNVGIGTTSPAYKLDVNGTGRFTSTVTATNFILSSDERLKENIFEISPKRIDANWKSFNIKDSDEGYRVGVIAQELEVNNPEFVETDINGYKSVKYIDLLISKIAELEDRIKQLEK